VLVALVADLVLEQVPHLEDEVAYLFQAQVFAIGKLYVSSPFHPNCFFAPFVLDYEGRRFGKYTPGWPALLAIGVALGQPWWVNAAFASITVALVFRLGREMHEPLVGCVAAGLATLSPFLLILSGSLMSHASCLAFFTLFLWCFWRSWSSGSSRWALVAGLALGTAFAIRPFTAIGAAIPSALIVGWRWIRYGEWKRLWFIGLGFAPLALTIPLTQAAWTGDPLLSPYVLFWPYDRVGFGPGHGLLEGGNTVWAGLGSAVLSVGRLANCLLGWPALSLTFVLLLFVLKPRLRQDLYLLATGLALILAYVAYWTNGDVFGPRYIYESSSALLVLSGAGIVRIVRKLEAQARTGVVVLLALLTCTNLFVYLPWQFRQYHGLYGISARSKRILEASGLHNALVIVRDDRGWKDYAVAFSLNKPTLDGDVVYASECPSLVNQLLAHFPGRAVYYFDGQNLRPYSGLSP
jgi:4-amino-4-deoxy-L-arabinose transferase-like glycosyltransferase